MAMDQAVVGQKKGKGVPGPPDKEKQPEVTTTARLLGNLANRRGHQLITRKR